MDVKACLPGRQQAGLHRHGQTVIEEGDALGAVLTMNEADDPLHALIM